ncbi:MarR family winged helix-turn-helix transcriptional regulator [Arthrobacter sp. H14-L1]|uniref:MarR family winged helix-turn-helix transcriptional regulator n=1 Tax=Arthrobacter sp. H14-L1 TaxID=2996697 RepID=UPI002270CC29|nr:helix-turn-helix domain-containing protein [Arthrobacter sp. H14-L1]MCY0903367.1 MarR family transcriptional regulator [Arthrobacter sp. H14-L1]
MKVSNELLEQMQYELMLLSRYQLRPYYYEGPMLERSAYVLLNRLERVEPMTLKELSRALGLDTSTIHRQVGGLLRHGYVCYAASSPSQVARRITWTESGREALIAARTLYKEGLDRVVGDWSAEKQTRFMELLRAFNQDVERLEETPWPRAEP